MFLRTLCDEDSTCSDDKSFKDASGFKCRAWQGYDCYAAEEDYGYTKQAQDDLLNKCRKSCDSCEEDGRCRNVGNGVECSGMRNRVCRHPCIELHFDRVVSKPWWLVLNQGLARCSFDWKNLEPHLRDWFAIWVSIAYRPA